MGEFWGVSRFSGAETLGRSPTIELGHHEIANFGVNQDSVDFPSRDLMDRPSTS